MHLGRLTAVSIPPPRRPLQVPHPHDFEGIDPRDDTDVFWRAPWLWPSSVRDLPLIQQYVTADELPGNLPIHAIDSDDWRRRCVMTTQDIWREDLDEPLATTRAAFTKVVYQRMFRFPGRERVPPRLGLDMWAFRTDGEVSYGYTLADLDWMKWRGEVCPRTEALCFGRPILRADFRYVRKFDIAPEYWDRVKWERRARSRTGYFVPMHCIEIDLVRRRSRASRYVALPGTFCSGQMEMPRGFLADLPPVLTYLGSELIHDYCESGLWVVLYSEWVAKVAAALLWEAYDNLRVWFTPPMLRRFIRDVDLTFVLGSARNYGDVLHLVAVIESTDWGMVPFEWMHRGNRPVTQDASPGRHNPRAGDFIYYDPWTRRRLNGPDEAELARQGAPTRPCGQRSGYTFDEEVVLRGCNEGVDSADCHGASSDIEPAAETNPGEGELLVRDDGVVRETHLPATNEVEGMRDEGIIRDFLESAGIAPSNLGEDVAALRSLVAGIVRTARTGQHSHSESTLDAPIVESTE